MIDADAPPNAWLRWSALHCVGTAFGFPRRCPAERMQIRMNRLPDGSGYYFLF